MQMKVTKQSIPGPDRGDETIQRKERDTRNSNKLMDVNPNNIDLLVATTKKVLQNYEVEAERNTEMERLLTKLDSVRNTHQNCSRGKDGLASTNNIEASGIPKEKYQTILVNKEAERHLTPSASTPMEGKTREMLERADPLVPTVSDEAGQERSMSLNMIPPAQGQHQSKHTLKKEGSQFLPNHCYDPIANEISGDLYTLKNQGSQVLRIVVLAVNEEDVPKGSMEMEISGATNLGLDSNLDTNLARIGLDSKESLNIPVMFPMKDNRNLAPKVEILWVIDRGK